MQIYIGKTYLSIGVVVQALEIGLLRVKICSLAEAV